MMIPKKFQQIAIRPPSNRYNVASFEGLPVVILQIIQSYLSVYDYRQLLYTNVSIFQHAKYETAYYRFCRFAMWRDKISPYHGFQDNQEAQAYYQELIAKGVKDKSKQVSLTIKHPTERFVRENGHLMTGIHELIFIDAWKGNFWFIKDINMNYFCNIYHLTLSGLHLTRLEGLQNIHILEIFDSPSLTFISAIPSLHRLVLIQCDAISDISQFGHVKELLIKFCRMLQSYGLGTQQKIKTDFSGMQLDYQVLSNVPYLWIQTSQTNFNSTWQAFSRAKALEYLYLNTNSVITKITTPSSHRFLSLNYANIDISNAIFQRLEVAEFTDCFIQDLSCLCNVSQLFLTRCQGSFDLRLLKKIKRLGLNYMNQIDDVSMLGSLTEVWLQDCDLIQDVSALGRVKKLSLTRLSQVNSLEGLGCGNADVMLFGFPFTDLSPIDSVAKVFLSHMYNLTAIKDLKGVKSLVVTRCLALEDLSGLSGLQSLVLDKCPRVRSLRGVQSVPRIHLQECDRIVEVLGDLGDQERLVINDCPVVAKIQSDQSGRYDSFVESIPFFRLNKEKLFFPPFAERSFLPNVAWE